MIEPAPRVLALVAFCLISAPAAAQPPDAADVADAPEAAKDGAVAALERFLDDVQSYTADFEQQLWGPDERLLEESSGTLALKRPNRFRWHYTQPMEQLIVTDGRRLWMYDVDLAQVTAAPLDDTAGASPAMLLSGGEAWREGFELVQEFDWDGLSWVSLAPRLPGAEFSAVLVGFDNDRLARLELVDGFDQVTRIDFADAEINPELDDELFDFEPPAGVDVLGAGD